LLFAIPLLSIILTLIISIPCSTLLNYLAFRYGFDPNNVVNPIMTAVDDLFTVLCFYFTILVLGVP
jgi:cation transporter-like permease